MRELWHTGFMHNRVRMITASFLIKDLFIDWRIGADWFMDTLLDADLANNSAGWQWVAGSGVDAAPYFRIFNPVLQGEKFDPHGVYVKRWIPELESVPKAWIHKPWEAPKGCLNITLGKEYPYPIVDHAIARQHALESYKLLKSG
jgi:deoxyribodipyrimidine photo-lyase